MPRPAPLIADYGEAQRLLPDFDHYLNPSRVTIAGLTGQTHVAALCLQKVAEAGRRQRERGVTDGTEVFAWSDLSLVSTGANGAALLRQFLRVEAGLHDEPEHSALMQEAWQRANCLPYWQPVALRTSYGRPTIPISGDINQLTEQLVRSRLADEFRPRSGVLEPIVRENRSSPAFILPSVDEEPDGRLIWSEPFIAHTVRFTGDFMLHLPNMDLIAVDVALPSSSFDRSAGVNVRIKAHTLAGLMAYEVEQIWRAFDTTLPANVRMRFGYTCFNMLNLFLLHNLYKSNPTAPVCSLHNFATYAQHAATTWLSADGYRRMYDWIMRHFAPQQPGSRHGREPLAETVVKWWTAYETFPSLSNERLSTAHRESHRQEAAALLREAFALVHNLIARHPPADSTSTHPPILILPLFLETVMPSSTK